MADSPDYHGYDTDFEWDRAYFIPIIRNFCFYYKFVPLALGITMNWLIIFKSPTYSKVYRRSLAFYHIAEFIFDIHHFILFVPYPIFPHPIFLCYGLICQLGWPPNLTVILTVVSAVFTAISLFLLIFIRMRTIVPVGSRFRLTMSRQVLFLERFDLSQAKCDHYGLDVCFLLSIGWLSFCVVYGFIMFPGIITHTAISLAKEKKKIVHVKKTKDNATKMLMIQMFGAVFTYISPLFVFFSTLKFGMPTSNPNFHSTIRFFWVFLFLNNSMVCYTIHLLMNRAYQKIIFDPFGKLFVGMRSSFGRTTTERISLQPNSFTTNVL